MEDKRQRCTKCRVANEFDITSHASESHAFLRMLYSQGKSLFVNKESAASAFITFRSKMNGRAHSY